VADRTPSLAEEARHLHACLFRAPLGAVAVARYEAALREMDAASSPVVSNVVSYEAALCETGPAASPVVANVVSNGAALCQTPAASPVLSNVASKVVAKVVARRLDAEAVEFALRRRGLGCDLARRMQILCYLVEVQPAYLGEFINVESSRGRAWAALLSATLRSAWKLVKGEYLVRRHGLV
jgi:hypothetical protein